MRSLAAALSDSHIGSGTLVSAIVSFLRRRIRHRTLASLEELDDRLLRDIGLTRGDLAAMRRDL